MDDEEDQEKSSANEDSVFHTSESIESAELTETVAALHSQIDDLKRELETIKKTLHKLEYERDSAQRNANNLKNEVKELSRKLNEERKKARESTCRNCVLSAGTTNINAEETSRSSQESNNENSENAGNKDLTATLEEAAADAMTQSGFVYDDRTGLYYDWNTGYYYDPKSRLYYENTTGTYYYYDEQSNSYKFHSKLELPEEPSHKKHSPDREEIESGEECSSEEEKENRDEDLIEVTEIQFPCIRAIVTSASKIRVGSLFIITYVGGTIGREKDKSHAVRISDVEVSKEQCKIEFDKERRQFFICDVGSRNGTFLNGTRLSESKQESEYHVITHGDELTLGSTTLLLHVHPGAQTCDACEPGQVQAQAQQGTSLIQDDEVCITRVVQGDQAVASSASVQKQMKSELKRLKKAYALEESPYCEQPVDVTRTGKYKDRAEVRRVKVGSDAPVVIPDEPAASVHRPISTGNVGRQMLEKMGWKEGEGLGLEGLGRREPVIVELRENQRGLGAGVKRSLDDVQGKNYIRSKTRERFTRIASVISGPQKRTAKQPSAASKSFKDLSLTVPNFVKQSSTASKSSMDLSGTAPNFVKQSSIASESSMDVSLTVPNFVKQSSTTSESSMDLTEHVPNFVKQSSTACKLSKDPSCTLPSSDVVEEHKVTQEIEQTNRDDPVDIFAE